MGYYLKLYFATLVVFFAVDMIWLGLVAKAFYRSHLGYLMTANPNWLAAIIFYLLFVVGLLVFVVMPGLKDNSLGTMLLHAALFGIVSYSTYDLTNLATIKDWPVIVTVADLAWGTFLSVVVSLAGFILGKWLR